MASGCLLPRVWSPVGVPCLHWSTSNLLPEHREAELGINYAWPEVRTCCPRPPGVSLTVGARGRTWGTESLCPSCSIRCGVSMWICSIQNKFRICFDFERGGKEEKLIPNCSKVLEILLAFFHGDLFSIGLEH